MRRISLLVFVVGLMGCKAPLEEPQTGILFSIAETEVSKTDALTQGDEIGVFASIEGTERYFLDHTKYIVEADGRSLSTAPAVYYPEAKQAVTFTAYLPFGGSWDGGVGTFSVPSDQTTDLALKEADLCWATASSTPVAAPVPLEFTHKMARLLITTNEPTTKIAIPNAFSGGILDIKTGTFTNTLRSEVFTTGTELILPAQTLSRLLLTVSGVEYTFEGAILLESGKTTSINLTLNPATHTATLSGSSIGAWGTTSTTGNPTQAAANTLTLHWPKCHPQSGSVDKVVLRIKDHTTNKTAEYTVSNGITYADPTFTVPFASTAVFYPYTIEGITLYQSGAWLHESVNIVGGTMVKRGACVVGVRQPLNPPAEGDYVEIDMGSGKKLKWAKGNLVAVNNSECRVGAPADGGLYFQFGSLIGWKGGAQTNGGTGVGIPQAPLTTNGSYWNGSGFTWASDAMVWPMELVGTKSSWSNTTGSGIATLSDYYFNYSSGWATAEQDIRSFNVSISGDSGSGTLASGRYAAKGVGDPCSYYLGGTWRLPTTAEYKVMCNNQGGYGQNIAWGSCGASWTNSPVNGGNFYSNRLFFPASGARSLSNGAFCYVTPHGYCWSSSVSTATTGFNLNFGSSWVFPQYNNNRSYGFPVRCVSSVP